MIFGLSHQEKKTQTTLKENVFLDLMLPVLLLLSQALTCLEGWVAPAAWLGVCSSSPNCLVSHGCMPSSVHLPGKGTGRNTALEILQTPIHLFIMCHVSVWSEDIGEVGE